LDVFQDSETLEEFEIAINSRTTNINNLDLNNDNQVDYISIFSYDQGQFHSIVLRVAVRSSEYQDVAVIEVSKNNSGRVIVQVIGDEALYGRDYIVEPSYSRAETPNPAYTGNRTVVVRDFYYANTGVYVDSWPLVAYLFSPVFSVYISPWHWGYYPIYYFPWTPLRYYNYWGIHSHYYRSPYYRRIAYVRYPSYHSYYQRRRTTSRILERNRSDGRYSSTYEGRVFRRPATPVRRPSRREIRRENSASSRQQVRPSIRQQNRESTRHRVQPSTRQQNRESTSQRVQPSTRQKAPRSGRSGNQSSTRHQNRQSIKSQARKSSRQQARPMRSATRQANRQIRESAREVRRSNRSERQKVVD
jgi:flagellar biosynthesis GTPase FlhF